MSRSSATTTLTLVPDIGTFNQYLICDKGDLWQNYEGDVTAPGKVVPDFSLTTPVLSLVVTSSRTTGQEIPDRVKFFLGAVSLGEMTRTAQGYDKAPNTTYAASFDLLSPTENNGNYGLRIKGNLVTLTNGESGQFRAEFDVSEASSKASLQVSCPFNISEVTSNSSRVVIEAGDGNNFLLTDKNSSVILKARYFVGTSEITTGLSYKWYKQVFGANPGDKLLENWQLLTNATATLSVNAPDVDTAQCYMVQVCDSAGSIVHGQDTQVVYDASDAYEILISRKPEDGQVHDAGDSVELSCAIVKRGSASSGITGSVSWAFLGYTPAGTPIFSRTSTSPKDTVSYKEISDAGGQLEVMVSAQW